MLTEAMGEEWLNPEVVTTADIVEYRNRNDVSLQEAANYFISRHNRTFDNPVDFFALWNWAKEQEWWVEFITEMISTYHRSDMPYDLGVVIDPIRFPELVAEFLEALKDDRD